MCRYWAVRISDFLILTAVAARCAFAKAGVGAVATQNVTNPALGPMVLEYLEAGLSASDAVANSISEEISPVIVSYWRLIKMVILAFIREKCLWVFGLRHRVFAVLLAETFWQCGVPQAMVECFENTGRSFRRPVNCSHAEWIKCWR